MRILVIQLARFGDIYQTWPVLQALQRQNPGAEIHILVRARFKEALNGLSKIFTHVLPTAEVMAPLYHDGDELKAADLLQGFLAPMIELGFDRIVNLSYSPASSFLSDILGHPHTQVQGYTRSADGYLRIPDDTSAYFYAQVGIGRPNRYHVTDIFAATAEVELTDSDWLGKASGVRKNQIIVHLGASSADKVYPADRWVSVLDQLNFEGEILLVGSQNERPLADTVLAQAKNKLVINRVGATTLPELMYELAQSRLLIGADSAPVHMAALTATPILNLSCAAVNFWETGPVVPGSRVLFSEKIENIAPSLVATEALGILHDRGPQNPLALRETREGPYRLHQWHLDSFSWKLIESLYTGSPYPEIENNDDRLAFQRLFEVAELALAQLARWDAPGARATAAQILEQVDMMLVEIPRMNPRIAPVVQWFQVQRLRIPPGSVDQTLLATRKAFEDLLWVSAVYRTFTTPEADSQKAVDLCRGCAAEIREWNFAAVADDFQTLVTTLHELARHSTKVGSHLARLNSALERKDYVELADHLEHVLAPQLQTFGADLIS